MRLSLLEIYLLIANSNEDDDTCPREAVLRDIIILIEEWQAKGVQICFMGDFNENVNHRKITERMGRVGLHEILSRQHGPPPNTYNRGTLPIDGIFCTNSIRIKRCGYTALDWGMYSDHRLLWFDICEDDIFGTLSPIWIPRARRLKLVDPRIVKKFLKKRKELIEGSCLLQRTATLLLSIEQEGMSAQNCLRLEKIDQERVEHILKAE